MGYMRAEMEDGKKQKKILRPKMGVIHLGVIHQVLHPCPIQPANVICATIVVGVGLYTENFYNAF